MFYNICIHLTCLRIQEFECRFLQQKITVFLLISLQVIPERAFNYQRRKLVKPQVQNPCADPESFVRESTTLTTFLLLLLFLVD